MALTKRLGTGVAVPRVKKSRRSGATAPWLPGIRRWALAALVATGACGGDAGVDTAPGRVGVWDSMGVVISENADHVGAAAEWSLGEEPVIAVGWDLAAAEEYQFAGIDGAIRLPGGGILVADGTFDLREYRADGTYVRAWGSEGEGPGDFSFIGGLDGWGTDSVVVWDRWPVRVTVFDARGNLGRTATLQGAPQLLLRGAVGRDGLVFERVVTFNVNQLVANWNQRDEYQRQQGAVEVWDAAGNRVSTIGPYPHTEYYAVSEGGMNRMGPVRHSRNMITGVWGSLVIAGPNDTYELRAHGLNGALERVVRLDRPLAAPGDDALEAADGDQSDWDEPTASHLPMFDRVIGDDLGYLWVRDYVLPGEDAARWTVFDSAGAVAARLRTSDRLKIWEIGREYVLGSQANELDIEAVVLLSLDRGGTLN